MRFALDAQRTVCECCDMKNRVLYTEPVSVRVSAAQRVKLETLFDASSANTLGEYVRSLIEAEYASHLTRNPSQQVRTQPAPDGQTAAIFAALTGKPPAPAVHTTFGSPAGTHPSPFAPQAAHVIEEDQFDGDE